MKKKKSTRLGKRLKPASQLRVRVSYTLHPDTVRRIDRTAKTLRISRSSAVEVLLRGAEK